jgi:hypothetical protein
MELMDQWLKISEGNFCNFNIPIFVPSTAAKVFQR